MAKLIVDYYQGPDGYVDNDEDLLLSHFRGEKKIANPTDTLFFLTTRERENILSWYPFKKGSVLEVGCGVGCVTGILCEKNQKVISIDQSKKRAEITYERHKTRDNLEVYAGNISEIKFSEQFDYIVLIGVLEYSRRFFKEWPSDSFFLKELRKLLKPSGILLLAIENRYGIKYFAGANEDHLNEPYVSLTGYFGKDVQTYGKRELEYLLKRNGFEKTNFFYPFPDYKLPSIIFSDNRLPKVNETEQLPIFTYGVSLNFSPQNALNGILQNGQFGFFANSFLVEAGTDHSDFSDISFAKFHVNRKDNFQIFSVETKDHHFMKFPRTQEAVNHLEAYRAIHNKLENQGINICGVNWDELTKSWQSEIIIGKSIPELIKSALNENGCAGILSEIKKISLYFQGLSIKTKLTNPIISDLFDVYKEQEYILRYGLMDLNASNLIFNENKGYIIIDQEWETDKQLPTDYALLCSIGYLYRVCPEISDYFSLEKLLDEFGLFEEKRKALGKISEYFFVEEKKALVAETEDTFAKLGHYEIRDNKNYDKLQEELRIRNEQVSHLSIHYNRVVNQIKVLEDRISGLNNIIMQQESEKGKDYKEKESLENQFTNHHSISFVLKKIFRLFLAFINKVKDLF